MTRSFYLNIHLPQLILLLNVILSLNCLQDSSAYVSHFGYNALSSIKRVSVDEHANIRIKYRISALNKIHPLGCDDMEKAQRYSRTILRFKSLLSSLITCVMIAFYSEYVNPMVALATPSEVKIKNSATTVTLDNQYSMFSQKTSLQLSLLMASEEATTVNHNFMEEFGLKPPTEEHPQIMLRSDAFIDSSSQERWKISSEKSKTRTPILQGLVYFPVITDSRSTNSIESTPQPLDYYSDVIVLTAVSASQSNGPILAGAKFPVSSIRFPFSFQMYEENILVNRPGVRESWFGTDSTESAATSEDIIIRARICPSDAASFPCDDIETKKYAEGVAKLVKNLPGLKEGEVIRAPASLPLQ